MRLQRATAAPSPCPRRVRASLQIGKGGLVGIDVAARAPPSIDMLHSVMRSSIDIARLSTRVLVGEASTAVHAERADHVQDDVLGIDARAELAVTRIRRTLSVPCASVCVLSTSRTWLVPMPKATAPSAPCVEVWRVAAGRWSFPAGSIPARDRPRARCPASPVLESKY